MMNKTNDTIARSHTRQAQRVNLPMPFGWFQVLYSHELTVGTSLPLFYFDRELVIFRTESGLAKVLDAHCAHMGAHLGYGIRDNAGGGSRVVGESIVCPFHGWQFNGEGECTGIPYAKNLPPRVARCEKLIPSWHVRELNQCIYVWYHPENIEPLFEPPAIPEAASDNGDWGELKIQQWDIDTHMQEIGENAVDAAHFCFVHGTPEIPEPTCSEFDGFLRHGLFESEMVTPKGTIQGRIENSSTGPGLSVVRFSGICDTVLMANITPIDAHHSRAHYAFIQRDGGGKTMGRVAQAIVDDICQQMEEDKIIWAHKVYLEKPLLCDGDGPFAKFRRWYGQFLIAGSRDD
ncbi:nitrite reductase/ring-hydroxylating ferredoxin subunit [Zhongshania antarctica]|uniref:cholesterol 7-desaturase n=1 Tax=Zhongshania antarctica TaxID=641702 RepID=A0A840R0Y0_9GAMM|nr:Rieske 2Fe-2S domain-containing protein [Zhongshania antarctica]MBB5186224.1 nitrite reductase/ring-hydroxylating ferredoxin subunit [Zhongshania antarctica]